MTPTAQSQIADVRERLSSRECGTCTECCTWVGVEEINKPCAEQCRFQVMGGCGIYDTRPDQCRGFYCLFRAGWGDAASNPSQVGWFACQADPLRGDERLSLQIWRPSAELTDACLDQMQQQLIDFLAGTSTLLKIKWIAITDSRTTGASNWDARIVGMKPSVFRAVVRWSMQLARSELGESMLDGSGELTEVALSSVMDALDPHDQEALANDQDLLALLAES